MADEMTAVQHPIPPDVMEQVLVQGDLSSLNARERMLYYEQVCKSLGLNPLTKPFEYLTLNGKLRLYALRDCADQLRKIHGISIYIAGRERMGEVYVVTARAKDRQGREDESTGAVSVGHLKGDALANALMKTETKAKRRVTLSIAGLGWLDETELETIPSVGVGADVQGQDPDPDTLRPTADDISSLVSLALSTGAPMIVFGDTVRERLDLPRNTRITKTWLRENLTKEQYHDLWQHYMTEMERLVEKDVPIYPPPTPPETHQIDLGKALDNIGVTTPDVQEDAPASQTDTQMTHSDGPAEAVVAQSPDANGDVATETVVSPKGSQAPSEVVPDVELAALRRLASVNGLLEMYEDNLKHWPDGMTRDAFARLKRNVAWRIREQDRQRLASS